MVDLDEWALPSDPDYDGDICVMFQLSFRHLIGSVEQLRVSAPIIWSGAGGESELAEQITEAVEKVVGERYTDILCVMTTGVSRDHDAPGYTRFFFEVRGYRGRPLAVGEATFTPAFEQKGEM